MSAIACGEAVGPAKYAAVSPGSTRVSRKVTTMTPSTDGIVVDSRAAIILSMARVPSIRRLSFPGFAGRRARNP